MPNNAIYLLLFSSFLGLFVDAANNQCNLGHKLFSVESGNSVCAPLAPFQCTHSCQWNTSCANTAHSIAFQGRRTFVAGLILTDTSFLILCCATLAHAVQQNQRNENRCVWVPPTKTVEHGPSIRYDPPLNQNEYVRDVMIKRLGNGQVEVRSQICKFITQRTNCDEATMPAEDKQAYSLLHLRLSRTESFFKDHNGTNPLDFFDLPTPQAAQTNEMRDDPSKLGNQKVAVRQGTKNQQRQMSAAAIQLHKNSDSPFIQQQSDAVESNIHSIRPTNSIPFAQGLPPGNYLPARVQPIHAIVTEGNAHLQNSGQSINSRRTIRPHSHSFQQGQQFRLRSLNNQVNLPPRHVPSSPRLGRLNGVAQLHANVHSGEFEDSHIEFPPKAGNNAFFSLTGSPGTSPMDQQQKPLYHRPRFILSTNQSYEIAHKYRRASLANRFHGARQHNLYKYNYNSADSNQIEERPFKSALAIRKLHLGAARQSPDEMDSSNEPISYGGSFGGSDEFLSSARHLRPFNNVRPFSSHKFPEDEDNSVHSPHGLAHQPKPSAPTLIFQPAQRTIVHEVKGNDLIGTYHTAHTTYQPESINSFIHSTPALSSIPPTVRPVEAPPAYEEELKKQESLKQLLDCCQQQAPGCRHLCTPSVSKEQIKRAIQTNECPPLSMTSVLQCFPRFYNITPVGHCCEKATQLPTPPPTNSLLANLAPSPRLPNQCQSLCEPNFKLSFSHFACVDHISTIVDCYRDLLVR